MSFHHYRRSYDSSDSIAVGFIAGILVCGLVFIAPLLGTLLGAFSGWVVGWFFPETVLGTLARFGVKTAGLEMWQLGACLGFVGGFFKTSFTKTDK